MLMTRTFFTKPWSNDFTQENPGLKITVKVKPHNSKGQAKNEKNTTH